MTFCVSLSTSKNKPLQSVWRRSWMPKTPWRWSQSATTRRLTF